MIDRTVTEVREWFEENILSGTHIQNDEGVQDLDVHAVYAYEGAITVECWSITITNMYSFVRIPLSRLLDLSKFFGTQNLYDSRFSTAGCEKCDYGSEYVVRWTIKPEEPDG